ncbi:hypothetical protein [Caballeronia cordobensis]|uniref:hypothetical protein n=1 Tax=Caballeronia cordobensis TaxID=1353886 RepID=UPI00045EECAE|nr:putative uncharacterized protein [Burkholderia sp. RPE67]
MLTMEQAREMRQGVTLSGDRNQCGNCGELFNSTYAFEKHRTGTVGVREGPDARRCLDPSQMQMLGMVKNLAGFWITERLTIRDIEQRNEALAVRETRETAAAILPPALAQR